MVNGFESVTVQRDCPAIIIPSGERVTLAKGREVVITQALGGTYTVNDRARLLRVAGEHGDALGKPVIEENYDQGETEIDGYNRLGQERDPGVNFIALFKLLKTCYDPEIPINIVDLGLIYDVNCYELLEGRYLIRIIMTLTAAGCGMGSILAEDIRHKCLSMTEVGDVEVNIVYDPPWSYDMISDSAKLDLGLLKAGCKHQQQLISNEEFKMAKWVTVASVDDLTPGQHIYVDLTTVGLLLINIDGEYYAVENVCSHDGGDLCEGTINGDEITCPRHGARFNIKTGEVLCAPAFENIDTYPVRVVDNMVQVCNQATK